MEQSAFTDIEGLEAISQDEGARRVFLRMAAMSRAGATATFLDALSVDDDLDAETKGTLAELARDQAFLFAVEEYLQRTRVAH